MWVLITPILRYSGRVHYLCQNWEGPVSPTKHLCGFSEYQTFIHPLVTFSFHFRGVNRNELSFCFSTALVKAKVQSFLCKHNIMCAPISYFLWYFISRAIQVNQLTDFYWYWSTESLIFSLLQRKPAQRKNYARHLVTACLEMEISVLQLGR